jgi:hypothetical protein
MAEREWGGSDQMTSRQKQPLIVSLVLAVIGSGIYVAAQRAAVAQQGAAEIQSRRLGDVSLHLATTFGEMKRLLGPPETVAMAFAQQGHVVTRHVNIRQVSWHVALIVGLFHVSGSDESNNIIADDVAPISVTVRAPFGGSLDGVRLGETCRHMKAQFKPRPSGSPALNCGGAPAAVPDSFTVVDTALSVQR